MIGVSGLRFGYGAGIPLFAGLDWEFPAGKVSAVTGPSGVGKSTLLYLLGLLLRPDGGTVLVSGENVGRLADRERSAVRAARLGFVFQDASLDPARTVLDNIVEGALYAGVPRREAATRARALMARFGVELRAGHRPGEVSGGQAQRVALCRALVKDPDVLLADEPTGNLDRAAAAVVLDALAGAAAEGRAVVISTHDPQVVGAADEILAL